jgi:hypothetical protein
MFKNFRYNSIYLLIAFFAFILGILFYLIYNNYIVIKFLNISSSHYLNLRYKKRRKALVNLYFYNNNSLIKKEHEIIQSDSILESLRYIINSWLSIAYQERYITKKVYLENIAIDNTGKIIFVSFSKPFIGKYISIKKKLYIVESFLKTINSNNSDIRYILFLVDNQPMSDLDINFDCLWPISGYISLI